MRQIRNFTIVGHIDHGKTTLTDRLIEQTGAVSDRQMRRLFMDQMELEQERGITIRSKTIRMERTDESGEAYILNLIDTPGHVDFSYEVGRATLACEGAVLIVDATQGVQAQTVAHFNRCLNYGLTIVPVVNKIDMPNAQIEEIVRSMADTFGFLEDEMILISAKTGENVAAVLETVVERIPAPGGDPAAPLKTLVFDTNLDPHQGIVAVVRLFDGTVAEGDEVVLMGTETEASILEVDYYSAEVEETAALTAGEVGAVILDVKDIKKCRVGDTLTTPVGQRAGIESLPGFDPPTPVVFADIYPLDADEYTDLSEALNRLTLTDASLDFHPVESPSLGRGFRGGFLGLLHVEIIAERVRREYELDVLVTEPRVEFRYRENDRYQLVKKPSDLPFERGEVEEPVAEVTLYAPETYLGTLTKICEQRGGEFVGIKQLGGSSGGRQVVLSYRLALRELIEGFYNMVKSATSGYASFEYQMSGWRPVEVVKLSVLLNKEEVPALTRIVPVDQSQERARRLAERLKELVPQQQYAVPVQVTIGRKVIARETISALRKDVTAKLYGGDVTRKKKLLEKQKKGKVRMKKFGKIDLPQEVFWELKG